MDQMTDLTLLSPTVIAVQSCLIEYTEIKGTSLISSVTPSSSTDPNLGRTFLHILNSPVYMQLTRRVKITLSVLFIAGYFVVVLLLKLEF